MQKSCTFLSCNVETNLQPTLDFYITALDGDKQAATSLIINNPTLFHYSLEHRLKPRLEEALSTGMDIDATILRQLGQCNDDKWYKLLILFMME